MSPPPPVRSPLPPADPRTTLAPMVESLGAACEELVGGFPSAGLRHEFPSRQAVVQLVEDLRSVLFPGYFGPSELTAETMGFHAGAALDRILHGLKEQIRRGFCATAGIGGDACDSP